MDEVLTFEEIKARYAPDWVLIGDPVTDEHHEILAGKVLFHSPNRDEVYAKVLDYPEGCTYGFRFLGEIPKDMVFILGVTLSIPRTARSSLRARSRDRRAAPRSA